MPHAPEMQMRPAVAEQTTSAPVAPAWARWVERAIAASLVAFALLLPVSVKGAHHAYEAAGVLWLALVVTHRRHIVRQPLVAPLLLYLLFSAISTILSPAPVLSWDRMKIVALLMICVVVAQNVRSMRQVKWIVAALAIGCVITAGIAARQMASGIGVQIRAIDPQSRLAQDGLQRDDVIAAIAGHSTLTPEQLRERVERMPQTKLVEVTVVRLSPFIYFHLQADRAALSQSGVLSSGAVMAVRPERAFGTFHHYIAFGELLLQLALFTWGVWLAAGSEHRWFGFALLFAFAVVCTALLATKTRSVLGSLLISALIMLWIAVGRRARLVSLAAFAVLALAATLYIHHTRGFAWIDLRDPGTQYRLLLWKDGLKLVRQHPWFGVGMESVRVYWQQWHMQAYAQFHTQSHFHSNWIQVAAERGLLTLAAWTWFVVGYLRFLVGLIRRTRTGHWLAFGVALGAFGAMIGFLIESVVQYNLGEEQVVVAMWFFAGLAFAADKLKLDSAA